MDSVFLFYLQQNKKECRARSTSGSNRTNSYIFQLNTVIFALTKYTLFESILTVLNQKVKPDHLILNIKSLLLHYLEIWNYFFYQFLKNWVNRNWQISFFTKIIQWPVFKSLTSTREIHLELEWGERCFSNAVPFQKTT